MKIIDIKEVQIKPIAMPQHQTALRRALLTSSYWDNKNKRTFLFWKGGEEAMKKRTIATAGFALCMLVAITAGAFTLLPKNTTTAYAEQVAQKSYQTVSNLTPEQQAQLKERVHMDPRELLQEAKNAKDLKTITYDQFMASMPDTKMKFSTNGGNAVYGPGTPPSDKAAGIETMDMHSLKFLQFTSSEGDKVTLGIDQQDLPVFSFIMKKDGGIGAAVRGGTTGGAVKGEMMFGTKDAGNPGKEGGFSTSSSDGKTITVQGKNYAVPSDTSGPSTVKVDDNGTVYINGVQATPEE
jgi:hypothetical protein